ncbi:FecR family protein [Chitinophaga sp. 22321]|uniref:FecR domain-containing protein n=1 Tax=Chitinophaga hostae TaxID=2831022 RepID=A0ABS5J7V2_9BACT|nr:FecR family protein [Chitinophaga hostae]MBS0030492.1 FecR domain-containing protein [Chitinophaga hostae]
MNDRLNDLLIRFFADAVTAEEQQELMQMILETDNSRLEPHLRQCWEAMKDDNVEAPDGSHVLTAILAHPAQVKPIRRGWYRAAAAIIFVLVTAGGFFLYHQRITPVKTVAATIPPGYRHAILVLDDGSVVQLDSSGNKILKQEGSIVQQQGAELKYDHSGNSTKVAYNTLSTPSGGQFKVTLPDGTMVWLNAGSSIRYPTVFQGNERRVEMKGEAYFDVARNAAMPFRISVNNQSEVSVLGTDFNINAYQDDGLIKTTLLSGAVAVSGIPGKPVIIKPGEQAQQPAQSGSTNIAVINNVNIDQVNAWRNGLFNFEHADLKSVMNEISRWYGVSIRYEGELPARTFGGKITRNLQLEQVLEILQDVNVRFRMEGKTIVVFN